MKTSLSHIPPENQSQILQIAEVIKEVIKPEKVILFGSYAKGAQVDHSYFEKGIRYHYISDYDFLVIPGDNSVKEYQLQDKIVNRFRHFNTPVNIIVHDINYVNEGLSEGQYFFTDIVNEGILLHDSGCHNFEAARKLSVGEEKAIAERYFRQWYRTGGEFLIDAHHAFDRQSFKQAAFYLHQSVEHFFNTALLVFTGYKPKTHNLDKLRQYAKHISEELFGVFPFPEHGEDEKHLFDLLKRGYIDARYKEDFVITTDEVSKLMEKVALLQKVVQKTCLKKISSNS